MVLKSLHMIALRDDRPYGIAISISSVFVVLFVTLCIAFITLSGAKEDFQSLHQSSVIDTACRDHPALQLAHLDSSQRPLHIAAFTRCWTAHAPGGMQQHAENIYSYLAHESGHCVEVFTTSLNVGRDGFTWRGFGGNMTVHFLSGTEILSYFPFVDVAAEVFAAIHKSHPFDVVHSESLSSQALHIPSYARIVEHIPVAYTWHGYSYEAYRSLLNMAFVFPEGDGLQRKNHVNDPWKESMLAASQHLLSQIPEFHQYPYHITISEQSAEDLLEVYHLPQHRVQLIHNGLDLVPFAHRMPEREACWQIYPLSLAETPSTRAIQELGGSTNLCRRAAWRKQLGIDPRRIVLGAAGRLSEQKGFGGFLAALPKLLETWPTLHVVVAGQSEYLDRLADFALSNEAGSLRVHVLGTLSQSEMSHFYAGIDLLVNPTLYYQGLDMVMQEAMLSGVVVIATTEGSIAKTLIPDNTYGMTYPISEKDGMIRAIGSILQDIGQIPVIGRKASQRATKKFSMRRMGEKYDEYFHYLVECTKKKTCAHERFQAQVDME
jgi:glycosyltransferase involved in cell wall biosynthesis